MRFIDNDGIPWTVTAERLAGSQADDDYGFVFQSANRKRFVAMQDVPEELLASPSTDALAGTQVGRPSSGVDRNRCIAMLALTVKIE